MARSQPEDHQLLWSSKALKIVLVRTSCPGWIPFRLTFLGPQTVWFMDTVFVLHNYRLARRENAPPADARSGKNVTARTFLARTFFSLSNSSAINLAPSVSESSLKRNDSALSGKNGGRKGDVPRLCMLIG